MTVSQAASTVRVTPAADTLVAVGDTVRLTAEALDANGNPVAGAEFAWASSDTLVAAVDGTGLVTATGDGSASVTAMSGSASGSATVTVSQAATLMVLYDSAGGPNWTRSDNWGTDAPLSAWYGVTTDERGRVTGLELNDNGLSGPIPPELGRLATLRVLDLGENRSQEDDEAGRAFAADLEVEPGLDPHLRPEATVAAALGAGVPGYAEPTRERRSPVADRGAARGRAEGLTGTIPPELGALVQLESLILHGNSLTGPIPPELGALVALNHLALFSNSLTGPIPPELGALVELDTLGLYDNRLMGPIPPELGSLRELDVLALALNQLTGPIPPELGDLANLELLLLWDNNLTGPIPPELGALPALRLLSLAANQLTGPILPELGDLGNLEWLQLHGNQLTGSIPPELGDLGNLVALQLPGNQLTGSIPPELGDLGNLVFLQLQGNQLTGPIPPELGNLSNLRQLIFYTNGLSGSIPPELGDLGGLILLDLGENNLSGPIPPELGKLDALTVLSLHTNNLSGSIPPQLGDLANLQVLVLHTNDLSGSIPQSFLRLGQLGSLFLLRTSVCVPGSAAFTAWLAGLENHDTGGLDDCSSIDRAALAALYEATGGPDWTNSAGWLTDVPLEEWFGVGTDESGRVVSLILPGNNLSGSMPAELGKLDALTVLSLHTNDLSGPIPLEFVNMPLESFYWGNNDLCAPLDEDFQAWLRSIGDHDGGENCASGATEAEAQARRKAAGD